MISQKNRPSLSLKEYTGIYSNDLYGTISLKLENNKLNIYFSNHPDLVGRLEHLQNDTFLCTYSIPIFGTTEIPFEVKEGKVSAVTLKVSDFIEFTPYEFKKTD